MPLWIKTGGAWHESPSVSGPQVKVSGTWRQLSNGYLKVAGVWRPFWVHSYGFNYTFGNSNNRDLHAIALSLGWDGLVPLIATYTVPANITIGSTSTGAYALSTGSGFPAGSVLTLINNGYILGRGGNGGQGANSAVGVAGSAGGPALLASYPLHIVNNGIIGGGGGGGGGGGSDLTSVASTTGGGGGGGAGSQGGTGGAAGGAWSPYYTLAGTAGNIGTPLAGGVGGVPGDGGVSAGGTRGGDGGTGGSLGSVGSSGGLANTSTSIYLVVQVNAPGGGGAAGVCSAGGNSIWDIAGTRYGTVG